jgi:TolB-like protein/Tfp pilus assembly protein PilF
VTLSAGSRLGPYEILSPLGAGGMGEVYRAKDPRLGREVAIKVLPASFSADPDRLRRFEQEARAAGILNHPNITAVYDIGTSETDGAPYVVQELLEGETLRSRLGAGAFTPRKALGHALQIAHGLAAAHEKGIVHRDLKPENIFVTKDGRVKILDFGLAKLAPPLGEGLASHLPTTVGETQPGIVLGTLGYMSPEQVRGKPADTRSDIFSFGAILYEMLSGERAFRGESAADAMSAILMKEPPDLSVTNQNVSPGLERVVRHCLEKNAEERFQSARDLAFDLESLSDISGLAPAGKAASAAEPRRTRSLLLAAGVAAATLALGGVAWLRLRGRPVDSVAVLPFVNGSRDANAEYLSDGITESIINSLSRLSHLRVTARSTVFHYKGRDEDPQKIGRDLNVRAVVSGKVIQRGDTLSIQADLVDVDTGSQIWGDHYERKIADIQSVQEEIARGISEKMRLRLTGEEKQQLTRRSTANTEAYQLYLKGRHAWGKRTESGLTQSIEYFRQAIEKDPGYSLAYAGLADSYAVVSSYSTMSPGDSFPRARAAAHKALEIDDGLAQAHATLGLCFMNYDRDWSSAESEYKKAIALDGKYATAHHWYGMLLTALGRFDEALVELRRAREIDPFSAVIQLNVCRLFIDLRQYDRAIEEGLKVTEMEPNFGLIHNFIAQAYAGKRMTREAIAEYEAVARVAGRNAQGLWAIGHAQALSGRRDEALSTVEEMKALSARRYVSPAYIAMIFHQLGDKEQFFHWWEKACEDRSFDVLYLKVDPSNDDVRDDPRFTALLRKAGLSP